MTKLQSECLAEIRRHAVTLEAVSDKVVRREKLLRIRELVSKIQSIDAHPSNKPLTKHTGWGNL